MARNATVISVSLPQQERKEFEALARKEGKSKSELMREALRQYRLDHEWQEIRTWGRKIAIEFGITSDDDVDRIAGKR